MPVVHLDRQTPLPWECVETPPSCGCFQRETHRSDLAWYYQPYALHTVFRPPANLIVAINDHISGIPNHDCRVDRLGESSTNGICSGNGMRADDDDVGQLVYLYSRRFGHTLQIPQATVHSSVVAEP